MFAESARGLPNVFSEALSDDQNGRMWLDNKTEAHPEAG
jgi:hypothetical protein